VISWGSRSRAEEIGPIGFSSRPCSNCNNSSWWKVRAIATQSHVYGVYGGRTYRDWHVACVICNHGFSVTSTDGSRKYFALAKGQAMGKLATEMPHARLAKALRGRRRPATLDELEAIPAAALAVTFVRELESLTPTDWTAAVDAIAYMTGVLPDPHKRQRLYFDGLWARATDHAALESARKGTRDTFARASDAAAAAAWSGLRSVVERTQTSSPWFSAYAPVAGEMMARGTAEAMVLGPRMSALDKYIATSTFGTHSGQKVLEEAAGELKT
jgi:hypothetical protein